jgi:hypothetical protein
MIIVLHPNEEQYNALNGYTNLSSQIIFFKDYSDRYILGLSVFEDPNLQPIYDQLNELERIEYTPFPPEPEL